MNWFGRHLNWTWVLAYLLAVLVAIYTDITQGDIGQDVVPYITWPEVTASEVFLIVLTMLIVSVWAITEKGRSLWWLLLAPVCSPLWLKNKKGKGVGNIDRLSRR